MQIKLLLFVILPFGLLANANQKPMGPHLFEGIDYWSHYIQGSKVQDPSLCLEIEDVLLSKIHDETSAKTHQEQVSEILASLTQEGCYQSRIFKTVLQHFSEYLPSEEKAFLDSMGFVAVYLSGLVPGFEGYPDRAGWWQLSFPIAVKYGLTVDDEIDERLDPVKSTSAAMAFFKDLFKHSFDEKHSVLQLVLGPAKLGNQQKENYNAYSPYHQRIFRELNLLKLTLEKSTPASEAFQNIQENFLWVSVKTPIETTAFKPLNPQLKGKFITKKNGRSVQVFVSETQWANWESAERHFSKQAEALLEDQDQQIAALEAQYKSGAPDPRKYKTYTYKVQSGDNLGYISEKYHVTVSDLREWNHLKSDMIRVGQLITIYTLREVAEKKPEEKLSFNPSGSTEYIVKDGDTLWRISQKFEGVSPEDIKKENGIEDKIVPGQKLIIPKP